MHTCFIMRHIDFVVHSETYLLLFFCPGFQFFAPLQPVRVEFEYGGDGRRTGEANVDFATHQEAMEAMKKHRANMRTSPVFATTELLPISF